MDNTNDDLDVDSLVSINYFSKMIASRLLQIVQLIPAVGMWKIMTMIIKNATLLIKALLPIFPHNSVIKLLPIFIAETNNLQYSAITAPNFAMHIKTPWNFYCPDRLHKIANNFFIWLSVIWFRTMNLRSTFFLFRFIWGKIPLWHIEKVYGEMRVGAM